MAGTFEIQTFLATSRFHCHRSYEIQAFFCNIVFPIVTDRVTMYMRCCQKKLEFHKTGDNGNAMLKKSLNFKDSRHEIPVPLAMSTYLRKKSSKLEKKKRKKYFLGRCWAKVGLRKLSQKLIRSGEIPSSRQTSIEKTNDCAFFGNAFPIVTGDNGNTMLRCCQKNFEFKDIRHKISVAFFEKFGTFFFEDLDLGSGHAQPESKSLIVNRNQFVFESVSDVVSKQNQNVKR